MNFTILGTILWCLFDILYFYIMSYRCSKKCNYDCSKCEDWHCNAHWCAKKRKERGDTHERI